MLEKIKNISKKCWIVLLVFFVVGYYVSIETYQLFYPEIITLLLGYLVCKMHFRNLIKISIFFLVISVMLFIGGWFMSGWTPILAWIIAIIFLIISGVFYVAHKIRKKK